MKKTSSIEDSAQDPPEDDLLPEYDFDYSKARPNRFTAGEGRRLVVLDEDVARVFTSPEEVNGVLRALIATMPSLSQEATSS